jgi:hypothetical protein
MNLTAVITAIGIAISMASGGWMLYQSNRIASIQLELSNERTDRANERLAIQMAARDAIVKTTGQVKQAQVDAAARNDRLAADLRRTAGQLDSLRIASDTAVRNASAGVDACTGAVRTYNVIFSQCAGQLSEVAGDADKWSSHALMFQDAWPR